MASEHTKEAINIDRLVAEMLPGALIFADNEEHLADARRRAAEKLRAALAVIVPEAGVVATMREALEPFATVAETIARLRPGWDHDDFRLIVNDDFDLTLAPFRTAAAALRLAGEQDKGGAK